MSFSFHHHGHHLPDDRPAVRRGCSTSLPQNHTEVFSWAHLPADLLLRLSTQLHGNRFDYVRFRSVCSHWSSVVPPIRFPLLLMQPFDPDTGMLPFHDLDGEELTSVHLPQLRRVAFLGCCLGWLFLIDEFGFISLLNPFTNVQLALPCATRELALASKRHVFKDRDGRWVLRHPSWGRAWGEVEFPVGLSDMRRTFISKTTLLSFPPAATGSGSATATCLVVAVLAESESLAVCSVGDEAWTLKHTGLKSPAVAVASCGRRLYAADKFGNVAAMEADSSGALPELLIRSPWLPRCCDRFGMLAPPATTRKELQFVLHCKDQEEEEEGGGIQDRCSMFRFDLDEGIMERASMVESMNLSYRLKDAVHKLLEYKGNTIWWSEVEEHVKEISWPFTPDLF